MFRFRISTYNKQLFGVLFKVAALSCFCLMTMDFQNFHPVNQFLDSVAIQFTVVCLLGSALLLLPILLLYRKQAKILTMRSFKMYFFRATLSIIGMLTWIEAVKMLGLSSAILVNYIIPLIVITIASLTKNERLSMICFIGSVACYAIIYLTINSGVSTVIDPARDLSNVRYGFILAVLSSICWAFYEIICKKQTATEHFIVQVFYTFLFASILLSPFSIYLYLTEFSGYPILGGSGLISDFVALMLAAIFRVTNVILLFLAIKFTPLNWLSVVSYMKLPIVTFWEFIILDVLPSEKLFVPCALLISINLVIARLMGKFFNKKEVVDI